MNDIVERLSGLYDDWNSPHSSPDGLPTGANIMLDAADEIARLRAEVKRLRAALDKICNGQRDADLCYAELFVEVKLEARAALEEK